MPELLIDTIPLNFQLLEGKDGKTGKIIARGEFARSDKATENKRLYRRHLWEREINRLNESMRARRTFGELDHPCLTSDDFRVLTFCGWKSFREIKLGDKVWSRNGCGRVVVSTVDRIINELYSGIVFRFHGCDIDATFTPAHRFLLINKDTNEESYVTAVEIADNIDGYNRYYIPADVRFPSGDDGPFDGKDIHINADSLKIDKAEYNGNIYCLKTTFGNFYLEHNGHSFWTGNSDGRTKLQRVSHLLTGLKVDGHNVIGETEILDTPNGRILKTIMEAGAQVGVSSRGFGSTKTLPDGTEEVQEDFRLDTFDFVADPATRTAYPQVFYEELQRIPEDDMGLSVEELKKNYPGLVDEISSQVLSESEHRIEEQLKERFSVELRRKIEQIDEAVEERVRSEYLSDPNVAGAKQVLERIASMVTSFASPVAHQQEVADKDETISKLEGDLAERDLEVQRVKKEHDEMAVIARDAAYRLHMERKIGGESARDAIVKLMGDMSQYKSIEELEDRIGVLQKELSFAREEQIGEEDEEKSELVSKLNSLESRLDIAEKRAKDAETKIKESNDRTRKAIEIAERIQVESYLKGVMNSHHAGEEIGKLCEGVDSVQEIDRIVNSFSQRGVDRRVHDEDEADRIRARIGRGKQRSLEEDTFGKQSRKSGNGQHGATLDAFGLTEEEFNELAGTRRLTS